ncbi:hypothetical protein HT136_19535 [Novosphingobium profundi]|uniref:hypothetical protein n=1 Tax=Novosphingobium profundi TaxID=1774954 RepID=UPI001BD99130|nr:hypothetical protein [Novosphingobium profundi]MBT0670564.1 hypothetical protein [Novosphingobium profundi]
MKTPYDAALRLRQREIDAVSERIARATGDLDRIETESRALDAAMRREAALAGGEHRLALASNAYFARKRRERVLLGEQAVHTHRLLDSLREEAVEALGSLRAIEGAATEFRTEAEREIARGEQGEADDRAALDFMTARRQSIARRAQ